MEKIREESGKSRMAEGGFLKRTLVGVDPAGKDE